MSQQWWEDDDQLLAALREAFRSARSVPAEFTATAKATFAWRDIDAELATLTWDSISAGAGAELAGQRADPASLRSLTFDSGELTLEIEVTENALLGQLVPPGPGRIEARTIGGDAVTTVINQVGGFTICPIPRGPFRLYCQTTGGANVLTSWLALEDPPGGTAVRP
jgi:hypothetical protein